MSITTIRALIAADIRRGLAYKYGSYSSYEAFMVAIGRLSLRRTRRLRNAATERLNAERQVKEARVHCSELEKISAMLETAYTAAYHEANGDLLEILRTIARRVDLRWCGHYERCYELATTRAS